jgi:hypothetical protein
MKVEKHNFMIQSIVWRKGPDAEHPYEANQEGSDLLIRLNDFPAENMYTLLVNQREVADFDDWPRNWQRGQEECNDNFVPSRVEHVL